MTIQERKALKLKTDPERIKPADKGGGVVIMSREYYEEEANRLLNDPNTYKVLKIFRDYLKQGNELGILDSKEFEYMNITHPQLPVFYFLPKVQKKKIKKNHQDA